MRLLRRASTLREATQRNDGSIVMFINAHLLTQNSIWLTG
jgi:hypothetical protein